MPLDPVPHLPSRDERIAAMTRAELEDRVRLLGDRVALLQSERRPHCRGQEQMTLAAQREVTDLRRKLETHHEGGSL